MSFEEWLLEKYGIEDWEAYLKEYDIDGTLTSKFVEE
jgi:hypothetical protein